MKALSYGLIYNPTSGSGMAKSYAEDIRAHFLAHGDDLRIIESSKDRVHKDFLKDISGLIVVGGDGTIRPYLPSLAENKIPVILFPAGNESLIAQQFKVTKDISELYNRVKTNNLSSHYYGLANGEPFYLMCSVGFDAEVVHWVSKHRLKYSSDLLYIKGILSSLFKKPQRFILHTKIASTEIKGSIIVANSPWYGGGISPVPEADSRFDALVARVFPGSYLNMVYVFLMHKLGLAKFMVEPSMSSSSFTMKSIDKLPILYQIDGDARVGEELKLEVANETVKFL